MSASPSAAAPATGRRHAAIGDGPPPDHAQTAIGPTRPAGVAPAAFEERERFAAYVAHEMRTPLATQRALLELALADPAADTATWREVGEDVLGACKQQEHLLEACLTLARSRYRLQRSQTVDLRRIVGNVVRRHDLHEFTTTFGLERALTSGDPDLIERLVANLVTNAVRHNHAGGSLQVATTSTGSEALVAIENTGRPIGAAEITRLFEPFRQLGPRTTARERGLGLGLVVVQAVADAHDAVVTATARPAGGLRIEVAFPAAPTARAEARVPQTSIR